LYDYVERRNSLFQTVVTAVVSNRELVNGLAVEVQVPNLAEAELEYMRMTRQESHGVASAKRIPHVNATPIRSLCPHLLNYSYNVKCLKL